jgi:hypothetical protein
MSCLPGITRRATNPMIAPTIRARIIDPIIAAPVLSAPGVDTISHYGLPEPAAYNTHVQQGRGGAGRLRLRLRPAEPIDIVHVRISDQVAPFMLLREGGDQAVTSTSHLAELEIIGTDVVAAWNALEPVVAQCAGLLKTPATKSNYHVGHSDDQGTVAGSDLRDCLDRVDTPASISVTYTASGDAGSDPQSIELRIMRYRRFKELNVDLRVTGPVDVHTLGVFERTKTTVAQAIDRFNEP